MINHTFLCNQKTTNCTSEAASLFLRHLDFDSSYITIDDTSVPFTGKVVVADTGISSGGKGDGCPIQGAEVCLKDKKALGDGLSGQSTCVKTDSKGEYSVPAVLGTTVVVEILYHDHEFEALNSRFKNLYDAGIQIEPGVYYSNNDFKDVSTSTLYVDVAGGRCNKLMGEATLEFSINGCDWKRNEKQVR